MSRLPGFFQATTAIGKVTFTEILRDRILYNVLLAAILILALGLVAAQMSFVGPERIVQDFGFTAMNLSGSFMAILFGAGLLGRELERRTAEVALARPISRPVFVTGKYAGLAGVLVLNWLLLALSLLLILYLLSGGAFPLLAPAIHAAFALGLAQVLLLGAAALFFSTFTTRSLAVVFSIGLFLVGHSSSEIRALLARLPASGRRQALEALVAVLPNLEHFSLGETVTYHLPVNGDFFLTGLVYGATLTAFFVVLSGWILSRRI